MTKQEYLLQQYIVETLRETGIKVVDEKTNDKLKEYVKDHLKSKDFRYKIIDELTDIIYKHFGI